MNKNTIKSHAFTLIELLVVIAIIGLLMAIITPALKKAKEQARLVICSSNNRQIAMATQVYAEGNDDLIPSNTAWNYDIARAESGGYWTGIGLLYRDGLIEAYDVFYCPSDKRRKPDTDYPDDNLKTIFPSSTEKPQWRIVSSTQYRIGMLCWPDEKIKTAKLRGSTGIVGDAASWASKEEERLFVSHKDRCVYSYIDGHVEEIKLWPSENGPTAEWWKHWIDQTEFQDHWPIPNGVIPECPY